MVKTVLLQASLSQRSHQNRSVPQHFVADDHLIGLGRRQGSIDVPPIDSSLYGNRAVDASQLAGIHEDELHGTLTALLIKTKGGLQRRGCTFLGTDMNDELASHFAPSTFIQHTRVNNPATN